MWATPITPPQAPDYELACDHVVERIASDIDRWCFELVAPPEGAAEIPNHEVTYHAPETIRRISLVQPGGKLSEILPGYGSNYRRLQWDRPSWTVTATCYTDLIHPQDDRLLTVRELARLQSFPDWWAFAGPRRGREGARLVAHVFAQIGNAVPPLLAYRLGRHLRDQLFDGRPFGPAISLFSGAGGMDIGLEAAGFDVRACVDKDRYACETLRLNKAACANRQICRFLANAVVMERDIFDLTVEELLDQARLEVGEAALVVGGPPCQPFSLAGVRDGLADHRSLLVEYFVEAVRKAQPAAAVFENVKGIRSTDDGAALRYVADGLRAMHYEVNECVLNAADYGVPQLRERVFLLAARRRRPSVPDATHSQAPAVPPRREHATVRDAFSGLRPPYRASGIAERIAGTIEDRKARQDPSKLIKREFTVGHGAGPLLDELVSCLGGSGLVPSRFLTKLTALCVLALASAPAQNAGISVDEVLQFARVVFGAQYPERTRDACYVQAIKPLLASSAIKAVPCPQGVAYKLLVCPQGLSIPLSAKDAIQRWQSDLGDDA